MKAIAHMEALFLSCAALAVSLTLAFEHPQFSAQVEQPLVAQAPTQQALPDA